MIEQDNNDENRENILLLNNKYPEEKEINTEKKTIMNNIQQVK